MSSACTAPSSNTDNNHRSASCHPHYQVSPRSRSTSCSSSVNLLPPPAAAANHLHHPKSATGRAPPHRITASFCFLLLLFTTALVFVQLLFHAGGIVSYTPLVCEETSAATSEVLTEQRAALFSEGARLRFPRTKRRLPRCIIIGARKCGTRALLEFLNLHPGVQKAAEEVHFFDDDHNYALGLDWYRRRMPYSFPGQITVEKSPAYFITPLAPSRIRDMDPEVRLLLIVREPVVRLISDYAQLASNKARKDRALASFEDRVLMEDGATVNVAYKAVRIGMYSLYFKRWLRTFPRNQIHIVDGDKLIVDPHSEVQRIESFLGIGHKVSRDSFYYNETKGFFCVRNATADKCLNGSKGRKHPQVSQEVVKVLRRFYAPLNRQFFKQAGVSFDWPSD